jgi:hypothetical protein
MPVSQIAMLSNFSKAYISQVKAGTRPVSQNLIDVLKKYAESQMYKVNHIKLFLLSREAMGCSKSTMVFYRKLLTTYSTEVNYTKATPIEHQTRLL